MIRIWKRYDKLLLLLFIIIIIIIYYYPFEESFLEFGFGGAVRFDPIGGVVVDLEHSIHAQFLYEYLNYNPKKIQ
jgi:hypothetical protein